MKRRIISILAVSLISLAALVGFIYFDFSNRNVTGGLSDELLEKVTLTYRSSDTSSDRYTDQWQNEYVFYPNGELRSFWNDKTKSIWDEPFKDNLSEEDAARAYIAQFLPHIELNKYISSPHRIGNNLQITFYRGIRPAFRESIMVSFDENGCLTGLGNRRTFVYSLTGKERRYFREQYRAYKKSLRGSVEEGHVHYSRIDGKLTAQYSVILSDDTDEMGALWGQSTTFTYEE